MGSEVAGHVSVHVSEAVKRAKGQVEEEPPHQREVTPNLFTPHHHHCGADLNPYSETERQIYIL